MPWNPTRSSRSLASTFARRGGMSTPSIRRLLLPSAMRPPGAVHSLGPGKKARLWLGRGFLPFAFAFVIACTHSTSKHPGEEPASESKLGNATKTICADGSDSLCSTLPTDMNGVGVLPGYIPNTDADSRSEIFDQAFLDYFGWQAFVALNWPADSDGRASTSETIITDTTSPRVWSHYPTKDEVFGASLLALEESACGDSSGGFLLLRDSKFDLSAFTQAFTPYPLIDRYGNFVLYDVRLSKVEVTYLESHQLTTKEGQELFKIEGMEYGFPEGLGKNVGSIEIKTSWRVMTDNDSRDSFYTTRARVLVPGKQSETGEPLCLEEEVGLVGMHIMQKFSHPEDFSEFWSWSTFEHIDNAPLADHAPISRVNAQSTLEGLEPPTCERTPDSSDTTIYSFYNAACNTTDCPVNGPPKSPKKGFKWRATQPYAGAYLTGGKFGTQVARCFKIYESAEMVTTAYREKLGSSPWASYQLVGVQWATAEHPEEPENPLKPFPAPIYLTNTTLETYLQTHSVEHPKKGAGSCTTCHSLAKDTAGNNSNFSFLPSSAR